MKLVVHDLLPPQAGQIDLLNVKRRPPILLGHPLLGTISPLPRAQPYHRPPDDVTTTTHDDREFLSLVVQWDMPHCRRPTRDQSELVSAKTDAEVCAFLFFVPE